MLVPAALALAGWELAWWAYRRERRGTLYEEARRQAALLGRPLVVIGAPDGGVTRGYDCGDITVDIAGSTCPMSIMADITKRLPFEEDSVVALVSCVLEYVEDFDAAWAELQRVTGGWLYVVRVEPWTLAAYFYPGARRALPEDVRPRAA